MKIIRSRFSSLALLALSVFFIAGCTSDTIVRRSYIAPGIKTLKFSKILIVALVPNDIDRRLVENTFKAHISKVKAQASHELIPGVLSKDDKPKLIQVMKDGQFDGVVVLRVKGQDTRVSQGANTALPMEYLAFSGYYEQVYDVGAYFASDTRGTYVDRIFVIETGIFDVKTEKLLWACTTKSTKGNIEGQNIGALAAEIADTLKDTLETQDLIP